MLGISDGLIRISVGIEDVEDLQADLEQADARPAFSQKQRRRETGDTSANHRDIDLGHLGSWVLGLGTWDLGLGTCDYLRVLSINHDK